MPPRRGPPQKLTQQQLTYFSLGLPIGFIAVSVAIVGLVVVWGALRGQLVLLLLLCCMLLLWCSPATAQLQPTHLTVLICAAADSKQQYAVSRTDFADLWRRAVNHNPFVQAFMLNFGAIGEPRGLRRTVVLLLSQQAWSSGCSDVSAVRRGPLTPAHSVRPASRQLSVKAALCPAEPPVVACTLNHARDLPCGQTLLRRFWLQHCAAVGAQAGAQGVCGSTATGMDSRCSEHLSLIAPVLRASPPPPPPAPASPMM
jgi:hypothetical protein